MIPAFAAHNMVLEPWSLLQKITVGQVSNLPIRWQDGNLSHNSATGF